MKTSKFECDAIVVTGDATGLNTGKELGFVEHAAGDVDYVTKCYCI